MTRGIGRLALVALTLFAAQGCGGGDDDKGGAGGKGGTGGGGTGGKSGLPTTPPEEIKKVASDGFKDPLDSVVKHDGSEIYFSAFTLDNPTQAAVFRVPTSGGSTAPLHAGSPFGFPTGLVLSCDSSTLYVADKAPSTDAENDSDQGAIFTLSTSGGTPLQLAASGIGQVTGLALSQDCKMLYVTGSTPAGAPAVFTLPATGGDATVLYEGAPLSSPAGLHVDSNNVAWVMDHLGEGAEGEGALFSVASSGEIKPVIGDLGGGVTMGVSLVAGGITAVMPSVDPRTGKPELVAASTETGEITRIPAPEMVDPGGVRTAREAGVLAITDHDANAIFTAK